MNSQTKNRRASRRLEKKVASDIGGKWSPSSGARGDAGDVRLKGRYRIEHKFTRKATYSLKIEDLYKVESECYGFELPAFVVSFTDERFHEIDCVVLIKTSTWDKRLDELVIEVNPRGQKTIPISLANITKNRSMCGIVKLHSFVERYPIGWSLIPYGVWLKHVNDTCGDD